MATIEECKAAGASVLVKLAKEEDKEDKVKSERKKLVKSTGAMLAADYLTGLGIDRLERTQMRGPDFSNTDLGNKLLDEADKRGLRTYAYDPDDLANRKAYGSWTSYVDDGRIYVPRTSDPGILAQEIGRHTPGIATGKDSMFYRLRRSNLPEWANFGSLIASGVTEEGTTANTIAKWLPVVTSLPQLARETGAVYQGLKHLKNNGATSAQMRSAVRSMAAGFVPNLTSTASQIALNHAVSHGIQAIRNAARRRRENKEMSEQKSAAAALLVKMAEEQAEKEDNVKSEKNKMWRAAAAWSASQIPALSDADRLSTHMSRGIRLDRDPLGQALMEEANRRGIKTYTYDLGSPENRVFGPGASIPARKEIYTPHLASPSVYAHELGHNTPGIGTGENSKLWKLQTSGLPSLARFGSLIASGATEEGTTANTVAKWLPVATSLPLLAAEASASYHGLKHMKNLGASPAQMRSGMADLGLAFGLYLGNTAGQVAVNHMVSHGLQARRNRLRKEQGGHEEHKEMSEQKSAAAALLVKMASAMAASSGPDKAPVELYPKPEGYTPEPPTPVDQHGHLDPGRHSEEVWKASRQNRDEMLRNLFSNFESSAAADKALMAKLFSSDYHTRASMLRKMAEAANIKVADLTDDQILAHMRMTGDEFAPPAAYRRRLEVNARQLGTSPEDLWRQHMNNATYAEGQARFMAEPAARPSGDHRVVYPSVTPQPAGEGTGAVAVKPLGAGAHAPLPPAPAAGPFPHPGQAPAGGHAPLPPAPSPGPFGHPGMPAPAPAPAPPAGLFGAGGAVAQAAPVQVPGIKGYASQLRSKIQPAAHAANQRAQQQATGQLIQKLRSGAQSLSQQVAKVVK